MHKKWKWLWIVVPLILVTAGGLYYSAVVKNPGSFLSQDRIINEINKQFRNGETEEILDIEYLDDRNVFVPFRSNKDQYGMAYWEWRMNEWELMMVSSSGNPVMISSNEGDPENQFIVWNLHPDDEVEKAVFYLTMERNFQVSQGEQLYTPRVQMKEEIGFEKSYGSMKMPADWSTYMKSYQQALAPEDGIPFDVFNDAFFPQPHFAYGWIPYTNQNEVAELQHTRGQSGFSSGYTETILQLNPSELESSSEES
ncbi:hypothetical protein [Jeotgalibacillus campisalis]|uniref:Uncharacterized protein n=1 Tax=Jeotgalibacillus campisalis TaxID=220754 RepID=A0A0C2VPP5_9BACL|nr:hypothetical protein [Jeotgalibacillus campisalis]KIL50882.1 hypothetical protein KR50_07630 [Jeotgalibacillus campisalis]